jgi:pimeloyl-ACP methyl ester carboxylesterase
MEAMGTFMGTFLCRGRPFPPPKLGADMANNAADNTVRATMFVAPITYILVSMVLTCNPVDRFGQCPFILDGSVGKWDGRALLPSINAPTLVFNGEYDTAQHRSCAPSFEHILRVRWVTLAGASHMSHLDSSEMRDKTMRLFAQFLLPEQDVDLQSEASASDGSLYKSELR